MRSPRELLIDRNFGPFFFGKLVSHVGMWIQNITAAILVFQLTESAVAVGAVSAFQFAPQILLAPWMGAVSDRSDRKRLLVLGRIVSLSASLGLALLIGLMGTEGLPGVWPIYVAALLAGIGFSISSPSMNALIPNLVPNEDLFSAIALNSSTGTMARATGPAVGATLYVAAGPASSFLITACGHLIFIVVLMFVTHRPSPSEPGDTSVREGLAYLRAAPTMITLLGCVWGVGFAADAVVTLTPPLAVSLGEGEVFVGLLASMFGVGALVALATLGKWQTSFGLSKAGVGGFAITATGFAGIAISPTSELALAAIATAGYGFLLATSSLTSQIQLLVPENLRGRIMAIWAVGFLGSRPIAAFINGWVADSVSVRMALVISVLVSVGAGALALRAHTSDD